MLVVLVRDRGAGDASPGYSASPVPDLPMDPHGSHRSESVSEGIGLRNIRDRLAVLYGSRAGVTLVRAGRETVSAIWVPLDPPGRAGRPGPRDLDLVRRPMSNPVDA